MGVWSRRCVAVLLPWCLVFSAAIEGADHPQTDTNATAIVEFFVSDPNFQATSKLYVERILNNLPQALAFLPADFWARHTQDIQGKIGDYRRRIVVKATQAAEQAMSPSDLNAIAQYLKSPLSQKWIAFRREFASSLSAGMVKREDEAKLEEETFSKEELREISELERSGVFARFNAGLRAIQEQMVRTAQVDDDAMWKDFMAWVKLTAEKEGYVK